MIEVEGLEFADDWTITPEQVAASAAEGEIERDSAIEPLEGLTGLTPEAGVPLANESAAASLAVSPLASMLEEVRQDDLVIFFPTETGVSRDNGGTAESEAPIVDDNIAPIVIAPIVDDTTKEAPAPPPSPSPRAAEAPDSIPLLRAATRKPPLPLPPHPVAHLLP